MKKIFTLLALASIIFSSYGQLKQIDFDAISKGTFAPKTVRGIRSMNDGEHYIVHENNKIVKYRYVDGEKVAVLFDANKHRSIYSFFDYQFSGDESIIMLATHREGIYRHSALANFWIFNSNDGTLKKLSNGGKQQEATLSPDGTKAAFVRDNNLFIVDFTDMSETQITKDGKRGSIINGVPDWVYEEEYSFSRAFEWSPQSDAIAFYRFDESRVKEFSMGTFKGELYPQSLDFKYPKAGEDNSIVEIKVYNLNSGKTVTMDIGSETNQYIPRIEWSGRPNELAIHRLNRLQNSYQLLLADADSGESSLLYNEVDEKYIERIDNSKVHFLPNGKHFIVMNESNGWRHLYLYDMEGEMVHQITDGQWEVNRVEGIDPKTKMVYFTANKMSSIGQDMFTTRYDKSTSYKTIMLTSGVGHHTIDMSKGAKYYISTASNSGVPTVVTLHKSDGKLLRVLEDNSYMLSQLSKWDFPLKTFFEVEINGNKLNAYILKPTDFDPDKKYPLFMTQYSGPGSQSVQNSWRITWEYALVKEGYIVACVDGRGTGGKGAEFRKVTYGNLGGPEVEDQIAAAKWFAELPFIDENRIGIYGWSFGGFMALNCILKGSDVFSTAVAVAPVTSWRYYDTIYTELYNGLPQDNPEGYDENSPIFFADNLRGKLLIAHGTADDNVHVQNAYDMIAKLADANKDFEWLIYPDVDHGMGKYYNHLIHKIIDFVKDNL